MKLKNKRNITACVFLIISFLGFCLSIGEFYVSGINPTHDFENMIQSLSRIDCDKKVIQNKDIRFDNTKVIIGSLSIPKLNLSLDIYNGLGTGTDNTHKDNTEDYIHMRKGVVYIKNLNTIFGHNMHKGDKMFTLLSTLQIGDKINVKGLTEKQEVFNLQYRLKSLTNIKDTDTDIFSQNLDFPNHLNLVTCTDKKNLRCLVTLEKI